MNPEDWALESFALSKNFVYSTPENQVPTDAYLARAKQISADRAALAGYRLAELINHALG
jgi:S1/P1 nuclease